MLIRLFNTKSCISCMVSNWAVSKMYCIRNLPCADRQWQWVCILVCVCSCRRLTLDGSGGQCLDETGARVRRWSWSILSLSPTPLLPVFLSLNKTVGVRVLGKEQVFVSFLARGQQAKFSVGTCCAQVIVIIFYFTPISAELLYSLTKPLCSKPFELLRSP